MIHSKTLAEFGKDTENTEIVVESQQAQTGT